MFTYIPKETRVQSEKSVTRAFRGHLNPTSKEIVRSRDVTFPDKLNLNSSRSDDDLKGGTVAARKPAPKDPDSDNDNAGALYEEGGLYIPDFTIEKGKQPYEGPKVMIRPKLVPQVSVTSRQPEVAIQVSKPMIQQKQASVGPDTPGRAWTMPPTPKASTRIQEIEDQSPPQQPNFRKQVRPAYLPPPRSQPVHQLASQLSRRRPVLQPQVHETIRRHMNDHLDSGPLLPPVPPQPRKQAVVSTVLEAIPESPVFHQSIEEDDGEDNDVFVRQGQYVQRATRDMEVPTQQAVPTSPLHLPGAFREDTPQGVSPQEVSPQEVSTQEVPGQIIVLEEEQAVVQPSSHQVSESIFEPQIETVSEVELPREISVGTITDSSVTETASVPPEHFIPRRSSRTRRSPERYGFPTNITETVSIPKTKPK
ncbi:hypothetical protein ACN38_g12792 [Penicillium nordicum]|uniref:Uncharacterized protein n=1 Tax=Penicillium nordicum TaxID=229535 RepID=A0A0M8NWR6_9EURO|nr:hypothetical protein ACN38_g12792 [Penicillium nordicum]